MKKGIIAAVAAAVLCAVAAFLLINVDHSKEHSFYQQIQITQGDFEQKQKHHESFSLVYYDPGSRSCQLSAPIFRQLSKILDGIPLYSMDVSGWNQTKQTNFFETYMGTPTWVYYRLGERKYVITGYNDLEVYKEALSYIQTKKNGRDQH